MECGQYRLFFRKAVMLILLHIFFPSVLEDILRYTTRGAASHRHSLKSSELAYLLKSSATSSTAQAISSRQGVLLEMISLSPSIRRVSRPHREREKRVIVTWCMDEDDGWLREVS